MDNEGAAEDDGCAFDISYRTQLPKRANAVRSGKRRQIIFFVACFCSFTRASASARFHVHIRFDADLRTSRGGIWLMA